MPSSGLVSLLLHIKLVLQLLLLRLVVSLALFTLSTFRLMALPKLCMIKLAASLHNSLTKYLRVVKELMAPLRAWMDSTAQYACTATPLAI